MAVACSLIPGIPAKACAGGTPHRERKRERETKRENDREIERERNKKRERERERERYPMPLADYLRWRSAQKSSGHRTPLAASLCSIIVAYKQPCGVSHKGIIMA
jgi:Ni/Co efflux regulator RcnB